MRKRSLSLSAISPRLIARALRKSRRQYTNEDTSSSSTVPPTYVKVDTDVLVPESKKKKKKKKKEKHREHKKKSKGKKKTKKNADSGDVLLEIGRELGETRAVMRSNVEAAMDRGEHLVHLSDTMTLLEGESQKFRGNASAMHTVVANESCSVRRLLVIGIVIFSLLLLIGGGVVALLVYLDTPEFATVPMPSPWPASNNATPSSVSL